MPTQHGLMERSKWDAYRAALKHLWKQNPTLTTEKRMKAFTNGGFDKRAWIAWVEASAETVPWCKELVVTAVVLRIQHEEKS